MNQLIVDTVRSLYLKHGGRNHREIEREMRESGHPTFTRRVFYNKKTERGFSVGWIERFGWRDELAQSASFSSFLSPKGTDNIAQGKAASGRNPGSADQPHSLPEWEQQTPIENGE